MEYGSVRYWRYLVQSREGALCGTLVSAVLLLAGAVSSATAADSKASCNGILVSSLAGQPGVVADLTREFHQEFKDAGVPPGFFDAAGAHEHAGSVEDCLSP
jgi:hypothetical protein